MGANDQHTVRALLEAESFDGPSLVIAYSHCIAHGYRHGQGARPAEERHRCRGTGRCTASIRGSSRPARTRSSSTRARPSCRSATTPWQREPLPHAPPDQPRPRRPAPDDAQAAVLKRWSTYERLAKGEERPPTPRPRPDAQAAPKGAARLTTSIDLRTRYLGLDLKHPIVRLRLPAVADPRRHPPAGGRRRQRPWSCTRCSRSRSRREPSLEHYLSLRHRVVRRSAQLLPGAR